MAESMDYDSRILVNKWIDNIKSQLMKKRKNKKKKKKYG